MLTLHSADHALVEEVNKTASCALDELARLPADAQQSLQKATARSQWTQVLDLSKSLLGGLRNSRNADVNRS